MDFNLEDLFFADFPEEEREQEFELKDFDYSAILEEVALHEASHFVLGVLVKRLNLGFTPINGLIIKVETDFVGGETMGGGPAVSNYDLVGAINWLKENPKRIIAKFLSTIVGYATYKFFFNDSEYFISFKSNEAQYKEKVIYYNLKTALKQNDRSSRKLGTRPISRITDYRIINDYFKYLEIHDFEQKLEICEFAITIVIDLLNRNAIQLSIRRVKNILKQKNGVKLEGHELHTIFEIVDNMTKKISLIPYISKFEKMLLDR